MTKANPGQAEKIYESERFYVFRIDDQDAAVFYGKGTYWGIANPCTGRAFQGVPNYFEEQSLNNSLFYYTIDKLSDAKSATKKIAHWILREENRVLGWPSFDSKDCLLNPDSLGKEFQVILSLVKEDASKRPIIKRK